MLTTLLVTGSLFCAMSPYGTPTEVAEASAWAYEIVQIDKMSDSTIQVSIDDIYNSTSSVFEATVKEAKGSISGIMIGKYSKNVSVNVKNGKILVLNGSKTYNCEIPGDYQTDYSAYVQ